jgi:hypothetical protein
MTADGVPALLAWALYMYEHSDSWVKRASMEVVTMLLMPEIIVAIHFEAEVGEYFEVTSRWHCMPGALYTRPGFRVFEIHDLYFGFMAPWWELAIRYPEQQFQKTFNYLATANIPESTRKLKEEQLKAGIAAGHAELVKMSRLLLSAPMIFVVLVNPIRGPSLLRAILAIVNANNYDIGEGWGEYEYAPPRADNRPEEEAVFYDLLVGNGESVTHWIQQLGLMLPCVRDDLQRLSKETPGCREHGGILEFKVTYPVIFAALEASFGLMPSNSRIAEQAHGGMRDGLIDGVSLLSTDMMRTYIMNDEYYAREM